MNQLNPYYERNYVCPICQMKFTSLSIRSSAINMEKRESDLHCIYRGPNPVHYSIVVCPVCKYAASNNLFTKELPVAVVNQLGLALSQLPSTKTDFTKERDLDTVLESFVMAIRTSQLKKAGPGELAGLLLAAAWTCREQNNTVAETSYLEEALKYYLQAFQKSSSHIGNLSDVQAAYLIGELYLRLGNYTESVNWFNRTIFHPNIKMNPNVEKQARDQWSIARSLANEQKNNAPSDPEQKPSQQIVKPASNGASEAAAAKDNSGASRAYSRTRTKMQMNSSLYNDQIDWLNQVVNRGYDSSKSLVTKEQVLRALLDACKEYLADDIPTKFANEAELKTRWLELLNSK